MIEIKKQFAEHIKNSCPFECGMINTVPSWCDTDRCLECWKIAIENKIGGNK